MPKPPTYKCKFCHSVSEHPGLCGTCEKFFSRRRREAATDELEKLTCRCSAEGYAFHIPKPDSGQTIRITIEGGAE